MKDYKRRADSLTQKDQATLKDMKIVQEMYARGYEFLPLDIYRAKATKFQIIDGKLMPPLSSIEGMGDKAADAVELAALVYLFQFFSWQCFLFCPDHKRLLLVTFKIY